MILVSQWKKVRGGFEYCDHFKRLFGEAFEPSNCGRNVAPLQANTGRRGLFSEKRLRKKAPKSPCTQFFCYACGVIPIDYIEKVKTISNEYYSGRLLHISIQ